MKLSLLLLLIITMLTRSANGTVETQQTRVEIETVASELDHPWGLDFLPDGRLLVSERSGTLRTVKDGQLGPPID